MADQYCLSYNGSQPNMVTNPLWLQAAGADTAISYSAQNFRALINAMFPTSGVVGPGDFTMAQRGAGANFSVDVSAGRCAVLGSSTPHQGTFLCESWGTLNLPTPAAPVSGAPRVHRVVVEALDKQAAGTLYGWQLHLLEDTGSGERAAPASSVTLGTVTIPVGAASVTNSMIVNQSAPSVGPPYGIWTPYTPVISGMIDNTGSAQGRYSLIGKTCVVQATFIPASPNLGSGVVSMTLPKTAGGATAGIATGTGRFLDGSGANRPLWPVVIHDSTQLVLYGMNSSLVYVAPGNAGYTWAAGSVLDVTVTYETA